MSTNTLDPGGTVLNSVGAAVVRNLTKPVGTSGSATAKDNGTNYEGEGITGSKPAHDWIFSRWNLGGGNGLGNRAGALSLLFFLILVVYVILVTAYLLYSIRLKKQGDERAARIAQGYVYPESKLTKWLRSTRRMMIGWQR